MILENESKGLLFDSNYSSFLLDILLIGLSKHPDAMLSKDVFDYFQLHPEILEPLPGLKVWFYHEENLCWHQGMIIDSQLTNGLYKISIPSLSGTYAIEGRWLRRKKFD